MIPMPSPLDFALLCATIAAVVGYLYGYHTGKCHPEAPCPKCTFHANEGRLLKAKAKQAAKDEAKRQAEFRHDYDHKGMGYRDGDPDRYDCPTKGCPRNRHEVDSDPL